MLTVRDQLRDNGALRTLGIALGALALGALGGLLVAAANPLIPFAILIALIASALAKERHTKLAAAAVIVASAAWLVGMAFAVLTSNPIY